VRTGSERYSVWIAVAEGAPFPFSERIFGM